MPKTFQRTVGILIALMLSRDLCSCTIEVFPGAKKARRHATAVFSGKVLNIRSVSGSHAITFAVLKSWKGIKEEKITLAGDQGFICGSIKFEDAKTYLVYAYTGEDGRLIAAEAPGYSKRIEEAAKDIKDLGVPRVTFSSR